MKISLIYPRVLNLTFPPLGILYIAAVLKKAGHEVIVVDIDKNNRQRMVNRIRSFSPSLIGLSVLNVTQLDLTGSLVKELKELFPEVYFVSGGTCATVLPDLLLNNFGIDAVVRGEGEETIKEFANALEKGRDLCSIKGITYKHKSKVFENAPREGISNLDALPFPAREMLTFNRYLKPPGVLRGVWLERSTTLIAGRGCPSRCIYCGSNLIFGRKPRRRSVANVIAEIEYLIENYKIDGFWFLDDTFTIDKEWVINFSRELLSKDIKLKWGCQARVNSVDLDMLNEMKRAGCVQLDFGVESGSIEVLKILKKDTTPDLIISAFDLTKKVGMRSLATFMVGNPGEKHDDIKKTLFLSKRINADFTIFFFTTAYPGTELFDMARKNSWLKNLDYSNWFVRSSPSLEINFKQKELVRIRSLLQNRFIIRNTFSTITNPYYLTKMSIFVLTNFYPFLCALKILIKTRNFDDFTFNFIDLASEKYGH